MTHTYTISNTTANSSTITRHGAGSAGNTSTFGGAGNITLNGGSHIYTTNTGTAGQIFTTTGTNGVTWANPNNNVMIIKQDPASLEVKGRMVINGVDLEERLSTIEKVLQIPERDVILEKKHPKLKKLYDEYIHALGKYRTFEAIKGEENGTT
jgi:hypothetical protein